MQNYKSMSNNATVVQKLYSRVKQNRGAINEIASRRKCHRNWVLLVLKGKYEDLDVLQVAVQVVQECENRRERITQELQRALA